MASAVRKLRKYANDVVSVTHRNHRRYTKYVKRYMVAGPGSAIQKIGVKMYLQVEKITVLSTHPPPKLGGSEGEKVDP